MNAGTSFASLFSSVMLCMGVLFEGGKSHPLTSYVNKCSLAGVFDLTGGETKMMTLKKPFFIAVASEREKARAMACGDLKTGALRAGMGYFCSDQIVDLWEPDDFPDITAVYLSNGGRAYAPLPRAHLVALFEAHGYKFYGPEALHEMARKPVAGAGKNRVKLLPGRRPGPEFPV